MLTGNDSTDANSIYFRADDLPLITDTAKAFAVGMLPHANVTIDTYTPPANDPLFSSVAAGVASIDYPTAVAAVEGRLGDDPNSLASAFASELALTRSILFNYSVNSGPPAPTPAGKTDVTDFASTPIVVSAGVGLHQSTSEG